MKQKTKFWDVNKIAFLLTGLFFIVAKNAFYGASILKTIIVLICIGIPIFLVIRYGLVAIKYITKGE